MLPMWLLCLAASAIAQQTSTQLTTTSQIESEDDGKTALYPTNYNYQPAAQQRRPVYTAPRTPETYNYVPYSFNYVAQGEDGSSSRQESSDASGRVVGSYTLAVEDGRRRVVDYVADENGFRATIDTNEPGTDVQSPADVVFHSAAIPRDIQQVPYRPANAFRPRPTYYSQPNVVNPVYHAHDTHAPYYNRYDSHAYDHYRNNPHGHGHASYYSNGRGYYW